MPNHYCTVLLLEVVFLLYPSPKAKIQMKENKRNPQLVAKRNTTLKVWKYFGFVPDENGNPIDNDTPKCDLMYGKTVLQPIDDKY